MKQSEIDKIEIAVRDSIRKCNTIIGYGYLFKALGGIQKIEGMHLLEEENPCRLTPRECKILEMRYGLKDGVTHDLETVGREFDVTRERIRQIEAKALEKILYHLKQNL